MLSFLLQLLGMSSNNSNSNNNASASAPKTWSVSCQGKKVPVTSRMAPSEDALVEKALDSRPFRTWLANMNSPACAPLDLQEITIQSVDMFGPRVGFLKIATKVIDKASGLQRPGIAFMRGDSVAVLMLLETEKETYTVLVSQDSIPTAQRLYTAIPAGMLDDHGSFSGAMAKEIQEETGLSVGKDELFDLTNWAYGNRWRGMIPSVGGCDEQIGIFYYHKKVTEDFIKELQGRLTGNSDEGEAIVVSVIPFKDLVRHTSDAKALCSIALYHAAKEAGAI